MGRPPGRSGESTRERILSAARERFGRAGYAATSLGQLAEDVGITPAAIYRYFGSKAELYRAAVQDAVSELVPRYREAIARSPSAGEGLVALIMASAELHQEDPSLAVFLSSLIPEMRREPELAAMVAEEPAAITEMVVDLVERARREGSLPPDSELDAVVGMFLACTNGLSIWAATFGQEGGGPVIRAFGELLTRALRQPPADTP